MPAKLTEHEQELLEILTAGASNKEAAKQLGIALRTLELHRQKVMQTIGAKSAAQLGYRYAQLRERQAVGA